MKSKVLILIINALFLSGCGYELPKTADNSTNSQTNGNAKNQSNETKNLVNAEKVDKNGATITKEGTEGDGAKLVLSGTGESATYPCHGREIEVEESNSQQIYSDGRMQKISS